MLKNIIIFIVIILLTEIPSFTSESRNIKQSATDWTRGYVISTGIWEIKIDENGKPVDMETDEPLSLNRARMNGYDRAKEIAMGNIAVELKNITVEYDKNIGDFLEENSAVQFRLSKLIENKIKINRYPVDFYKSGCTTKIKISDLISIFPFEYPSQEFPVILNNPISTEYTGLIIDARKLNVKPMLFPVIYNEEGLEIYGRLFIDVNTASRYGIVSYAYNDNEASQFERIGARPYYAVAVKNFNGSPVLSEKDVKRILSSSKTLANLKKCKVIFILDRT